MLKNIISPADCAQCRICCVFEKYELWDTPLISAELKGRIEAAHPDFGFIEKGVLGSYIFNMAKFGIGDDTFRCPTLGEKGCTLGADKPFECRIFPFRLMKLGGYTMITVSPVCPAIADTPIRALIEELDRTYEYGLTLAEYMFCYGDDNPDVIKIYEQGYPVLKVRKHLEDNTPFI